MSSTMFDAREALMPGRVIAPGFPPQMDPTATYQDAYYRTHDRMGYIGAERTVAAAVGNIPIPVGMFLPPMPPQPHNYYNQVQVSHCTLKHKIGGACKGKLASNFSRSHHCSC